MHRKLGWIVGLAHALFYIGIGMMIYLYFIDNNSPLWFGSILLVIVGIIGSAIPDSMINIGIEGINIQAVRWTMTLKYIVFMGVNLFLTKFFWVTSIGVILIFGVDSLLEMKLADEFSNYKKQRREAMVSRDDLMVLKNAI